MSDKLLERWDCMEDGRTYLIFLDEHRPDRIYIRDYHGECEIASLRFNPFNPRENHSSYQSGFHGLEKWVAVDLIKLMIMHESWTADLKWARMEVVLDIQADGNHDIYGWFAPLPSGIHYHDFMREFDMSEVSCEVYYEKKDFPHMSSRDFIITYLDIAKKELKQKAIEFLQEGIHAIKEIE